MNVEVTSINIQSTCGLVRYRDICVQSGVPIHDVEDSHRDEQYLTDALTEKCDTVRVKHQVADVTQVLCSLGRVYGFQREWWLHS